ncbi:hypothetical protein C8R45DRAFT_1025724 [Mycena sanguinolenta]|nr:hypothetical protein C8R45DRAFT_1025724 [Mycena sanguinolenta]
MLPSLCLPSLVLKLRVVLAPVCSSWRRAGDIFGPPLMDHCCHCKYVPCCAAEPEDTKAFHGSGALVHASVATCNIPPFRPVWTRTKTKSPCSPLSLSILHLNLFQAVPLKPRTRLL